MVNFKATPRKQIDVNFVQDYVACYRSIQKPGEAVLERRLKKEIDNRDYLSREQLLGIAEWKVPTKRINRYILSNDNEYVREVTHSSFTTTNERFRVESLTVLSGVSWPLATAILHFRFPDRYTILDFRALWTLGYDKVPSYNFEFWDEYNKYVRAGAKQLNVSIREMDMALWAYSEKHQR